MAEPRRVSRLGVKTNLVLGESAGPRYEQERITVASRGLDPETATDWGFDFKGGMPTSMAAVIRRGDEEPGKWDGEPVTYNPAEAMRGLLKAIYDHDGTQTISGHVRRLEERHDNLRLELQKVKDEIALLREDNSPKGTSHGTNPA